MKELISINQANQLMYAVLIVAPILGLIWGVAFKRVAAGFVGGLLIGIGNLLMWRFYNHTTDTLGLDSVKNLLVNMATFIGIGLAVGLIWGLFVSPRMKQTK